MAPSDNHSHFPLQHPINDSQDDTEDSAYYKDNRSAKRPHRRHAKQSANYYGFRGVDPNWVGQVFDPAWHSLCRLWRPGPNPLPPIPRPYYGKIKPTKSHSGKWKPRIYTRRDLWHDRETEFWPSRRHHVGKRIRDKWAWKDNERVLGRRGKQKSRSLAFEAGDHWYLDDDFSDHYEDHDEAEISDVHNGCDLAQFQCDDGTEVWSEFGEGFIVNISGLYLSESDQDDFSIISERDFDVISIASTFSDWEGG